MPYHSVIAIDDGLLMHFAVKSFFKGTRIPIATATHRDVVGGTMTWPPAGSHLVLLDAMDDSDQIAIGTTTDAGAPVHTRIHADEVLLRLRSALSEHPTMRADVILYTNDRSPGPYADDELFALLYHLKDRHTKYIPNSRCAVVSLTQLLDDEGRLIKSAVAGRTDFERVGVDRPNVSEDLLNVYEGARVLAERANNVFSPYSVSPEQDRRWWSIVIGGPPLAAVNANDLRAQREWITRHIKVSGSWRTKLPLFRRHLNVQITEPITDILADAKKRSDKGNKE
jgi:hypothetical protein